MQPYKIFLFFLLLFSAGPTYSQKAFSFTLNSAEGDLTINVLGHASVLLEWNNLKIYVDPNSRICDYSGMDNADIILITHEHEDHFDANAFNKLIKDSTMMIYTATCKKTGLFTGMDTVMANGDSVYIDGFGIKAIPAYNIVKSKHVKGVGNGYILTFGDRRIYLAGDTEVIPEMASVSNIDVAFLGYSVLNMDTNMFLEALSYIKPTYVIPYHYDNTDITSLINSVTSVGGVTLLTESPVTSISQLTDISDFNLYPNPAAEYLKGDLFKKNYTVIIVDHEGRVVLSNKIIEEGSLDVRRIDPGNYVLLMNAEGEKICIRFSIIR